MDTQNAHTDYDTEKPFESDYDANKPEEAGATYVDFVKQEPEDEERSETIRLDGQYKEVMATHKCPVCGGKADGYEVTNSRDPDDMEASGERAFCTVKSCGWKMELDF